MFASTIATVPRTESADRGRRLLAERVERASEFVDRVPDRLEVLLERPSELPRCLVVTGIGTSEGHARHLAELAAGWMGQPARFATTGSLMRGAPPGSQRDWLVVFSQGLSPNARHALADTTGWGGVVLITGVGESEDRSADPSNEAHRWLREIEARGVVCIDMGCGPERGLLLRVIGSRVGYALAWSLLRTLAERRLEPADALRVDRERLRAAQAAAVHEARRLLPEAADRAQFFAADRSLLLVSDGGRLELAEQLSLKLAEGMLRPQPRCVDVLQLAHGPLQALASRPLSILYLGADPGGSRGADPSVVTEARDWSDRVASTLDPALHDLRVLRARLPWPFAILEFEAMLDEWIVSGLEESDVDLVAWPGAEREAALYGVSPPLETRPRPPAGPAAVLEDAVWPEVEAWIEAGRRTALVALGSIEQHGPHLPLGTDRWIAQALVEGLAARVDDAVALPAVAVGCASEHLDFPGTLHVEPETLEAVLRDLLRSIRRHGFRRAFVFTAHGGNLGPLDAMRPRLTRAIPDLAIHLETAAPIARMQARLAEGEGLPPESAGPHAGEYETSVVARLRPGTVRVGSMRAGRIVSDAADELFYPSLRPNADHGVLGDPTPASAARGDRYLDAWLDLLEAAYAEAFAGGAEKNRQ